MDPQAVADLVIAMALTGLVGTMVGAFIYEGLRDLLAWLNRRPGKPPTAQQLEICAAALRRRAGVLQIRAEKLRLAQGKAQKG
jgi:hypothetical protein